MPEIHDYDTTADVARAAAEHAVTTLSDAITARGRAVWVLAGGSSPIDAYRVLVGDYARALDWSRITVLIGDERIVPVTSSDSNWGQIRKILFESGPTAAMRRLAPDVGGSAEDAAAGYEQALAGVLAAYPRLDLLWLGVGPDGHTLSLAPGRPELLTSDRLVIPVHDFPAPPLDRLSFTLKALENVDHAVVFATSDSKKAVLKRALKGADLPIVHASRTVEDNGGIATWLFDATARS